MPSSSFNYNINSSLRNIQIIDFKTCPSNFTLIKDLLQVTFYLVFRFVFRFDLPYSPV